MTEEEKRQVQGDFAEQVKNYSLIDLAHNMLAIEKEIEGVDSIKSMLQAKYDYLRFGAIPAKMDEEGVQNIAVKGVGKVYLTSDMNVSVKPARQEEFMQWLRDTGRDGVIKETVHSSTLKSVVKTVLQSADQENLNQEWLNVNPFVRAAIKDRAK